MAGWIILLHVAKSNIGKTKKQMNTISISSSVREISSVVESVTIVTMVCSGNDWCNN